MPTTTSRCCLYPQGDQALIVQFLAVVSLGCALLCFRGDFACLEYQQSNRLQSYCFPLRLSNEAYWTQGGDWGASVKMGALFGLVAVGGNLLTAYLLGTASCFALTLDRIRMIGITYFVVMVCQLLTLVALAADVCQNSACEKLDSHPANGAIACVFAFLMEGLTLGYVYLYWQQVKRDLDWIEYEVEEGPVLVEKVTIDDDEDDQNEGESDLDVSV